jgi:hypothetical protein
MLEQKRICERRDALASSQGNVPQSGSPVQEKDYPVVGCGCVAQERAAESIGISFQNRLALAMERFRTAEGKGGRAEPGEYSLFCLAAKRSVAGDYRVLHAGIPRIVPGPAHDEEFATEPVQSEPPWYDQRPLNQDTGNT